MIAVAMFGLARAEKERTAGLVPRREIARDARSPLIKPQKDQP
jgi:hypothetical protein